MATKFKGICKGLKYISQIFDVKEREMEIGYPTDVKHVAHIGWDGASDTPPCWMSEFKPGPDFNTSFGGNPRENNSLASDPWSSQDCDQSKGSGTYRDSPSSTDVSSNTKRHRRKKKKLSSSSMSNSSVSSRRSTKSKYSQTEPTLSLQV